jgi:uncharacterized protein YoaH (UPF0181 family)
MTDNRKLVFARIAVEMDKGTSSSEVVAIVAAFFRQEALADEAGASKKAMGEANGGAKD